MNIWLPLVRLIVSAVCAAMLSAGCGKSTVTNDIPRLTRPVPEESASHATTYALECDDGSTFAARIEGETAWLLLPTGTVSLLHVPSGSGAKYADEEATFWIKGEEAVIEAKEGTRRNCRNNRANAIWEDAKLRGADFRAVGNEPGWNLEISKGGEIVYVGDYGQTEYRFPTPDPMEDRDARRTVYSVEDEGHEIVLVLEGRRCQDTMSDEEFETTVTVVLDGKEYRGCGRALY